MKAFFEQRTDARPLALARVLIGFAAFVRGLASYSLFNDLLVPGVVRARTFEWVPYITREAMPWYIGAWLFAAGALAVGYRTRLNAGILFVLIAYQLAVGQEFFWSHIYFLCCLVLLLGIADAGADLSFDWRASGGGRRTVERWAVTLLKMQISIVYFISAAAKVNPSFLAGNVLGKAVQRPEFLKAHQVLLALSWGTIALEGGLAFALWFKPLRPYAILAGLVFHASIPGMMGIYSGLAIFSVSITATYVLFLDAEEFSRLERFALQLADAAGLSRVRETLMKQSN